MTKLRVLLLVLPALAQLWAQPVDPDFYSGIRWRLVGPFRGGKATMVSGIPANPAVYYMGTAGSGVWKTVDGGQVWTSVSDSVQLPASARSPSRRRAPRPSTPAPAPRTPPAFTALTTAGDIGIWSHCRDTVSLPS